MKSKSTSNNHCSGQQVHEIDIPAELCQHALEGTHVNEIFKYKVDGVGKTAMLVRESAD